jgi:pimeloyl-ACP methyl ester carboxylesterase
VLLVVLGILVMALPALVILGWLVGLHFYLRWKYLHLLVRIFQEKPLFVIPRGKPVAGAEDVRFPTVGGLTLSGCYLKTRSPRRGVILFGLEFGSDRWSCLQYCEHLVNNGYDVFAFEPRNQGESDSQAGYEPLQWVTTFEVEDTRAALAYLKGRPDADPRGLGLFGISKGAGAGLLAAAADPYVRCFVTDGVFATYSTLVPYMRSWFRIYNSQYLLQGLIPPWYYGLVGLVGLKQIERQRGCRFPHLENALGRLGSRPLLMIHGGEDTYIKPDMARTLFQRVKGPADFWLVVGAKHNQALQIADGDYERRVLAFFDQHLSVDAETQRRGDQKSEPGASATGVKPGEVETRRRGDSEKRLSVYLQAIFSVPLSGR